MKDFSLHIPPKSYLSNPALNFLKIFLLERVKKREMEKKEKNTALKVGQELFLKHKKGITQN